MEDGVAVLCVASTGHLGEILDDGIPFAERQVRKDVCLKAFIEGGVAHNESAIEKGDGEFEIIGIYPVALLQRARGGACAQTHIPHGLRGATDDFMMVAFDALVRAKVEDVNVGIREELFASEAASGDKRNVQALRSFGDTVPYLADDIIDGGRAAANRGSAVSSPL